MPSVNGDVDYPRLCRAVRNSRRVLAGYRRARREAARLYAGKNWGSEDVRAAVPLNLLAVYNRVVLRNLVSKDPRVMLSTTDRDSKAAVSAMEGWANLEAERICLAETLQRVAQDALFSVGICKVSLVAPDAAASSGYATRAGVPLASRIDLDDLIVDTAAKDFEHVQFIGHRYRVPLEAVRETTAYHARRKKLTASEDSPYNTDGDERIGRLGRGGESEVESFEDEVDLVEIYLPRRKLVVTLAWEDIDSAGEYQGAPFRPLREVEWVGPEKGPYHVLSYGVVPGNLMPKGPISDLVDLHSAVNGLLNKLIAQGQRQKEVLPVRGPALADGQRLLEIADGEAFRCDNAEALKAVSYGGPNAQNFALMLQLKDLFSWAGGNLDILGGLSPQSKTATQDKLLAANSAGTVADMQQQTVSFTSSVFKAMTWYWWHDPYKTLRVNYSPPGLAEVSVTRQVTPEQRTRARWADLDIKVDPYSLAHSTPQERAMTLQTVTMQVVAPLMPMLAQQGVMLDANVLLTKLAKYLDMPDLSEIVTIQEPPQVEGGQGGAPPGMPAATSRTYERTDTGSTRTDRGTHLDLVNRLMGSGAQSGEMNGFAG